MNTSSNTLNCYEVTEKGIRAVTIDRACYRRGGIYLQSLVNARFVFTVRFGAQKPRIAPRMGVASPSVVAA